MEFLFTCIRRFKDMGPNFYIIGDQFIFKGTEEEAKQESRRLIKEENYSEIKVKRIIEE